MNPLMLLGIVFVVLKLTDVISWSWWWVLAPIWGGALLAVICVFVTAMFYSGNKRLF